MKLRHLWYPSACKVCGAGLEEGERILCESCLKEGGYWLAERFAVPGADGADAPLVYKGFVRNAMHAYKFRYHRAYADWFAALAGDCLSAYLDTWRPDMVTFVPLGFGRWMKRGYNQSGLVAGLVARRFGLPCARTLRKRMGIRVQSSLSHEQRAANIKGAFRIRRHAGVSGKRVLLMDDVVTTGSTAAECVQTLREAGARAVYVLSMTKTPVFRR